MTPGSTPLLQLRDVNTHYGPIHILQDVSIEIHPGEIVCLLGGNASGKSTTLKTILGLVEPSSGVIEFSGEDVTRSQVKERIGRGMAVVPENRRVFPDMTVEENLELGAYVTGGPRSEDLDYVLSLFPRLKERIRQQAGTLSGGEQQMLAMGRALMSHPRLLLMDEPSMGLAPILVSQNFELISEVNKQGTTVFMVEQNANMALSIADRGYVLQTGRIVLADKAARLRDNDDIRRAYLGR